MNDENETEEGKTLAEVFEFDELSPEQRREHLRQADRIASRRKGKL